MKVKQTIRALNSVAKILESSYSKIDINEIIGSNSYDFDKVSQSATWLKAINNINHHHHHSDNGNGANTIDDSGSSGSTRSVEKVSETEEYGISSFVYRARKPFHPMRLMNFIENELVGDDGEDDDADVNKSDNSMDINNDDNPTVTTTTTTTSTTTMRVLRSKGFFWLASRSMDMMIWSQAGGLFHLTNGGAWWADTPRSEWPSIDSSNSDNGSDSSSTSIEVISSSNIINYHSDDNYDSDNDEGIEEVKAMIAQIESDWQEPYGDRR